MSGGYADFWQATGDANAPRCARVDGIGTVEEVRDRLFAVLG